VEKGKGTLQLLHVHCMEELFYMSEKSSERTGKMARRYKSHIA